MILPDRMFSAEWIHDRRLRRLPPQVQLLLIFVRPLCDRNGRFEFNPALIHMALYASADCGNVSVRDVEAWLEILRSGGYVKSYTGADGRRVGEVAKEYWRQKLTFGKQVYEPESDQPELVLPDADPPQRRMRSDMKGGGHRPPPMPAALPDAAALRGHALPAEDDAAWMARLAREWPGVDIAAQLEKAHRKRRGDVERGWFEAVWLPGVTPRAPRPAESRGQRTEVRGQTIDPMAAEAALAERRAHFAAMAEPTPGTLDHTLWEEARKTA